MSSRSIFWRRLWAFLNYRTRIYFSWRHLLAFAFAALLVAWSATRAWAGIEILFPLAVYLLLFGFADIFQELFRALRRLHDWLYKPLEVKPDLRKKFYPYILLALVLGIGIALWNVEPRLTSLYIIVVLIALLAVWVIHRRETDNGKRTLTGIADRLPVREISPNGEIVRPDGSRAKIAILTQAKSGFKSALAPADITNLLTKFLAFLAQYENRGLPIKFFWLSDYHLGQLDIDPERVFSEDYLASLRELVTTGALRARVILSGIIYAPEAEERLADYLAPLDLGLSPLGAYAAESFVRHLLLGESFLAQIEAAHLAPGDGLRGLPNAALRGFIPDELAFGEHLTTGSQRTDILRIDTPFSESKDALLRALQNADGFVCVEIAPLPRSGMASEYRGKLLAARVPGLGRSEEARLYRQILEKLEDRRTLEYLFETRTHLALWGKDDRSLQQNRALAEGYLPALNYRTLTGRALEDSLGHWFPVLEQTPPHDFVSRVLDYLAAAPVDPSYRLLSEQLAVALHHEEGSDVKLADARGRILLGRSVTIGKEGLRYVDFRADTGPILLVSDQGGGKSSSLIVWFLLRLQLLKYKIVAVNLKYSSRMSVAVDKVAGIVLHPQEDLDAFRAATRAALFSDRTVLYQPVKGVRPYAIADDPCLLAFVQIFYEEWLPARNAPAALVIDEIHRLMPKDQPLSQNASQAATLIAEAFKDWAERKLVIAAATQTLRDLYGSNLGLALQKFRTNVFFQVGPEDRAALEEKGYSPELVNLIIGERRRPRGYGVLVMPDGFFTTIKILVTSEERDIIQRLDVEETADTTPQLVFK